MRISVIIPTLNEETSIAHAIASAYRAGAAEVIVVDGRSTDGTVSMAQAAGARVLHSQRGRGLQLERGVLAAQEEGLLFLHADTVLPEGACAMAAASLESGAVFGGFRIAFTESHAMLRVAAVFINVRTRLLRCPWGDQAQFTTKTELEHAGGIRPIPLLEDYDLARRMRLRGPVHMLRSSVRTSGRRFLRLGVLRTAWVNWHIIRAFRSGTDPVELARRYAAAAAARIT